MQRVFRTMLFQISFVIVLFWLSPAYASPTVSIQPSSPSVTLGDSFTLEVSVSNITDLYAFQFDISFDPAVLEAVGLTEGSFLPTGGGTFFISGTVDNAVGSISYIADSLLGPDPGVTGSGHLVALSFEAIGQGISPFGLSNLLFLDSSLADISVTFSDGTVNVSKSTVPEPATMLLLSIGLLIIIGVKRKFQNGLSTPFNTRRSER